MADEPKAEGAATPPPPVDDKAKPAAPVVEPKAEEPKKEEKVDGPANGAPEKYADFKLPEGLTLNAAMNDEFKGASKELGLSQEKAQKLVDLYAKSLKAQTESIDAEVGRQHAEWKAETLKLLGANADKEMAFAAKARDKFGDDKFAALMNDAKLGDHPAVVQFLIKVGKAISEDVLVEGKAANEEVSLADALYGKPAKK